VRDAHDRAEAVRRDARFDLYSSKRQRSINAGSRARSAATASTNSSGRFCSDSRPAKIITRSLTGAGLKRPGSLKQNLAARTSPVPATCRWREAASTKARYHENMPSSCTHLAYSRCASSTCRS
jgi:hypothetical protein